MASHDTASAIDATPTLFRLMRHQVIGLFCEGLLRSSDREEFATLVETSSEKGSFPPRAGSLLIRHAGEKSFVDQLASSAVEILGALFWTETSEHLIIDTTCRFNVFGTFIRFASSLSFIPARLWENSSLPSALSEASGEFGLDALCRFVMESARQDAQQRSKEEFQHLVTESLRERLHSILGVLKPPAALVATVFSSAVALASYYAWVIAFDATVRKGLLSVAGVGSFKFVKAMTENRIDFSPEQTFWKLIKINAEKPPLPDEIAPDQAAA